MRDAIRRPRSSRLVAVSYRGVLGLGSGTIPIEPFATAFAGGNGAGKSSLLSLVHSAVQPTADSLRAFRATRLRRSTLSAVYVVNGQELTVEHTFDGNGERVGDDSYEPPLQATAVDLARQIRDIVRWATDGDVRYKLEGAPARRYTEKEIRAVSRLTRKRYAAATEYEVELASDPSVTESEAIIIPYFEAEDADAEGVVYGIESMGQGEAALFLLDWHLRRLAPGALLLLEEPEAHVPDLSQDAVVDALAVAGKEKGASIVLTTHSARVVSRIPREGIRTVFRDGRAVSVVADPQLVALRHTLDIDLQKTVLLLCEDQAAEDLVRSLLRAAGPELAGQCEVSAVGDADAILMLLRTLPLNGAWFSIVGVLDGDMRSRALSDPRWPFIFLPGSIPPEEWCRQVYTELRSDVASALRTDESLLAALLRAHAATDLHDWLPSIAKGLGCTRAEVLVAGVTAWVQTASGREGLAAFERSVVLAVSADEIVKRCSEALGRAGEGRSDAKRRMIGELSELRDSHDVRLRAELKVQLSGLIALHDKAE